MVIVYFEECDYYLYYNSFRYSTKQNEWMYYWYRFWDFEKNSVRHCLYWFCWRQMTKTKYRSNGLSNWL